VCNDDANEADVKDEGEEEADEDDQVDGRLSLLNKVHPWQNCESPTNKDYSGPSEGKLVFNLDTSNFKP